MTDAMRTIEEIKEHYRIYFDAMRAYVNLNVDYGIPGTDRLIIGKDVELEIPNSVQAKVRRLVKKAAKEIADAEELEMCKLLESRTERKTER